MGFFDWLTNIFSSNYDATTALQFVKKTKKFLIIQPEDRSSFEKAFLSLAETEIKRQGRKLSKEEVNILVQRVRIKLTQKTRVVKGTEKYQLQQKEWEKFKPEILEIFMELENQRGILHVNCDSTDSERVRLNQLQESKKDILRIVQKFMAKAKSKAGYFSEIDLILQKEIKSWIEIIHQIDARMQGKISEQEFRSYIVEKNFKENRKIIQERIYAKSA